MGSADAERGDAVVGGPVGFPLVRAAAALRWTRPDLTATLAELALDAATDAGTWVAAAGWLLHGRAALGDGRDTAADLLDGLGRWGEAGLELMGGAEGRRLRVELAGSARRVDELDTARALLAAEAGVDDGDLDLRADVLTELARCAVDDASDQVDEALTAAQQAWQVAGCAPGLASVALLRAVHTRRAGRADDAAAGAAEGLGRLTAGGRRAGGTAADHVAAVLTAEWIAALVEAGRVDVARDEALPAANRLIATARPGRQIAGLRLAIARVTAIADTPDAVLAGLEPAAQNAADSDVPELESACRSMLGELHETAGRLDAALAAVRAAMAAERRDRDRSARLRTCLVAPAATWARRPSGGAARMLAVADGDPSRGSEPVAGLPRRVSGAPEPAIGLWPADDGAGAPEPVPDLWSAGPPGPVPGDDRLDAVTSTVAEPAVVPRVGGGRRARRLAAEALAERLGDGFPAGLDGEVFGVGAPDAGRPDDFRFGDEPGGDDPRHGAGTGSHRADGGRDGSHNGVRNGIHDGAADVGRGHGRDRAEPGRRRDDDVSATSRLAVTQGWVPDSGSLIGDALLRELADDDVALGIIGARSGGREADPGPEDAGDELGGTDRDGSTPAVSAGGASALDTHTARRDGSAWADRPPAVGDTVVFDALDDDGDHPAPRTRSDGRGAGGTRANGAPGEPRRTRHTPSDADRGRGDEQGRARHADPADTVQYDRSRDVADRPGASGARRAGPSRNGAPNGSSTHGSGPTGSSPNGSGPNGSAAGSAPGDGAPGHGLGATPDRQDAGPSGSTRRGTGRPSSADPDGLSLGDLLAGALAAYRNL